MGFRTRPNPGLHLVAGVAQRLAVLHGKRAGRYRLRAALCGRSNKISKCTSVVLSAQ